MRINKEGYKIIGISGAVCLLLWWLFYHLLVHDANVSLLWFSTLVLLLFWFFIVAFGFGLILQILVTEVPGLTDIFLGHSNGLEWYNWMICAALGIVPLIVHEIAVPFFRKREVI